MHLIKHDRRERHGTEPVDALSALRLRLLLSAIFAPVFALAAAGFAVAATRASQMNTGPYTVLALVCAALALMALIDLAVVVHRLRREDGPRRRP